jgi:uncharacterized protein DUF3224
MTTRAAGTFDVRLTPRKPDDEVGDAGIGRMSLDKQFHGDLAATSKGTMLAAGTATKASAGLAGSMAIIIADGKHSYEFDYSLTSAS